LQRLTFGGRRADGDTVPRWFHRRVRDGINHGHRPVSECTRRRKRYPWVDGTRFARSQAYPAARPTGQAMPWKTIDFRANPTAYLNAVLRYCYDGNIAVDWQGQNRWLRKRAKRPFPATCLWTVDSSGVIGPRLQRP
jgi:hypothetical protein